MFRIKYHERKRDVERTGEMPNIKVPSEDFLFAGIFQLSLKYSTRCVGNISFR